MQREELVSQQTRKIVLGSAALAIIALAVVLYAVRGGADAELSNRFTIRGVCLETGQEVVVTYTVGERAPFVNPATGRRTVYTWYYCRDCNKRFVPELLPASDGGPPRLPVIPACPLCGGTNMTGWTPDDPDQAAPAGDAPLPKWPGK